MKIKLSSIIFLVVMLAPALTCFIWMNYQESVVKFEVELSLKKGIDKNELALLKFTKAEAKQKLNWEHAKEFEYNAFIYDVVETESVGDSIFYWCWPDIKETQLENTFTALVNEVLGSSPFQTEKQEQIISYFKTLYCQQHTQWQGIACEKKNKQSCDNLFNFFSSNSFAPFSPPPELS